MFLVGAGPGDPGLLTLRAVECLRLADLIIYDKLVPPRLLEHASRTAECRCMGDLPGGRQERWSQVMADVIAAAKAGKTVVRLKGGDPLVFGRGLEEAAALREADISYEIVPGVSAALAAGACAEIPLTHRTAASAVAFVTGHEDPTKSGPSLDWAALARFPGTLAIYMGMARLETIAGSLIKHGKPADTPAVVVAWAGTGGQKRINATLGSLADQVRSAGLRAPAIILLGESAGLAPAVSWFESRPLFGKRVLVTRPREQAAELVRKLELLGAIPVVLPAVEIRPPQDWGEVDDRLSRLGDYDWLVFASANGVQSFLGRLRQICRDLRALAGLRIAAIGPGTAEALRGFHLNADLVPDEFRSESLAAALAEQAAGKRILLARADRGRDVLRTELSKVAAVDQVTVYRQVDADVRSHPAFEVLGRGEIDFVTVTSSNIARSFLRSLDEAGRSRIQSGDVLLVTISPVTSAAVTECGYPVAAEAREFTIDGLIQALLKVQS
ncbi:MAG TPA: uroporphyrinogen-III C-methyltransferase [Gemmataceae bacterium]|nr:uroporphyrinogen-III C-methyltransferase [Gemmataceae bacterium]